MRRPLAIVIGTMLVAGLAWTAWWWLGVGLRERAIAGWLAGRQADGWVAEAGDIRRGGFPYRTDLFVDGLMLADPEAGWSWTAEEFDILAMAWRPHEVIVAFPGRQVIETPLDRVEARGEVLRASARFEPNTRLALARATLEAEALDLAGGSGWTARVDRAVLASRQAADGTPFAHDVSLDAKGILLPDLVAANPSGGALPRAIESATLDATLGFDRPWDRPAVEAGGPLLQSLEIRGLEVVWGELRLQASGRLEADAGGLAEGRLDLRARNWQDMLALAEDAGALEPGVAGAVRAGLGLLGALGGNRDELEIALDFGEGRTRLGPIPLGPAPRLAPPR